MINYIVTTVFCLWATLLGPSFLHTQGQSGSQPRPNAPESSAPRQMNADAFIAIAGVGRPAPQALLDQLNGKLPADLQSRAEMITKSLSEGKTVEDVPPALRSE